MLSADASDIFVGADDSVRPLCAPILFFLFFEKEKNRRRVRRRLLHFVSAGAAKTPYPQSPSSFPKADRFAGSPFGSIRKENGKRSSSKLDMQTVPPSCDSSVAQSDLPAPNHLSAGDYVPHAILMMAVGRHFANTVHEDGHRPLQHDRKCSRKPIEAGGQSRPPLQSLLGMWRAL